MKNNKLLSEEQLLRNKIDSTLEELEMLDKSDKKLDEQIAALLTKKSYNRSKRRELNKQLIELKEDLEEVKRRNSKSK